MEDTAAHTAIRILTKAAQASLVTVSRMEAALKSVLLAVRVIGQLSFKAAIMRGGRSSKYWFAELSGSHQRTSTTWNPRRMSIDLKR
ncbi:hypothetical protein CS022_20700 [Veronia nyctiphanis]|uniref:Uncharacterized protein n=1 Tax=Veronia nyctiphanis TaxID=1278244 RepID=A0A4Q0YMA8_9GAMM|nr:hypothetical protein CS022_20700 [Veronia nyctiphanis]